MDHEVLALEKSAIQRWRNGDPSGWAELGADDITYTDHGMTEPIRGLQAYREYLESLVEKIYYQGSEFIDPKVVQVGDAALLTYNYRPQKVDQNGHLLIEPAWNVTEVYFRQGGVWKLAHSHWSLVNHTLAGQVEIPLPVFPEEEQYPQVLKELLDLERQAMQRWRKGDPWGFIEISAPEVTYMDTGTPQRLNGIDALREEYVKREGKIYYDVMDFIGPLAQVQGDLAILFYRFLSTWLKPDGSVARRIPWNCTEVYMRYQAEWKIAHTHWSLIHGE